MPADILKSVDTQIAMESVDWNGFPVNSGYLCGAVSSSGDAETFAEVFLFGHSLELMDN